MFMFRRKRNCLVKRLWKARIKSSNEVRSKEEDAYDEDDNNSRQCCGSCCILSDEGLLRNAVLKRLQINQLEMLVEAVESGGACISTCVLIPKDVFHDPHLFCCQLWRWPDLRNATELRRTPACHSTTDPIYTCCNPYHWSRLCDPELPPPPYSRYNGEKCISDDGPRTGDSVKENYGNERLPPAAPPPFYCQNNQEPNEFMGSFSTNGDSALSENEQTWCKLAYWELTQRVGRMYPVQSNTVNVFWTDMQADGLSLEALAHHTRECFQPPPQSVCKNRTKIGLGITLSLEDDGVWVYNRSEWPIFVNSANIDETVYRRFLVYRVPAGHCFRIFVPGMASHSNNYWDNASVNSVRISFAKGWGPKYTRQEIISCPTWLEIHMSPYR